MSVLIVALRLVHILSAIVWVGGSFAMGVFVMPAAKRLGPEGGRFMQNLVDVGRVPIVLTIAGVLATLAGAVLFVFVSGHFDHDWMRSPMGVTLSVGAAFGIAALLHGVAAMRPVAERIGALAREIGAAGGPPSPEQLARMTLLRDKLEKNGKVSNGLLVLAASAMAIARYV